MIEYELRLASAVCGCSCAPPKIPCIQGSHRLCRQAILGPPPYSPSFTICPLAYAGAKAPVKLPSIPNQSFVKYVTVVFTPTALALNTDDRKRTHVAARLNC